MEASKTAVDHSTVVRRGLDVSIWGVPIAVTLVSVSLLVVLFFDTLRSIVAIWSRSGTFAHGYLIVPISLYLIWDERDRLESLTPRPSFLALPAIACLGFGWLCCRVAGIQVMEQYFAVATIPVAVWGVMGTAIARQLAFPLGFLLLGVPVGEVLIPPLIDFTAAFTVAGLRLSGVPVLQEGNFLTLANSRWSVVEACSGLRYLIACFTLGLLYAHLTYRSWWRRGLCLVAAIVVPIIANGLRAYMIVMLGYASDMTIAVGIDHLIYGWIFFGVVILLFFWVGSFFREDHLPTAEPSGAAPTAPASSAKTFLVAGVTVVLFAAAWPAWASAAEGEAIELATDAALPPAVGEWQHSAPRTQWQPHFVAADLAASGTYERRGAWVGAHVACYAAQTQGSELVNSSNLLVARDSEWRQIETARREVALGRGELDVVESTLDAHGPKLLVWNWYWIEGTSTVSPYRAKLLELTGKLAGQPPLACGLTVFTRGTDDADSLLADFLNAALPSIESSLVSLRAD